VLAQLREHVDDETELARLAQFWQVHAVDAKADDARALLAELAGPSAPAAAGPAMARTESSDTAWERERRILVDGREVALAEIADHVHLHSPDRGAMATAALNRGLALALAELLEVRPTAAEIHREADSWRARHDLTEDSAFADWLCRNRVSAAEFEVLAGEAAQCRALHRWMLDARGARGSTGLLLDHLRWTDEFTGWARSAASCAQLAESAQRRAPAQLQRLRDNNLPSLAADHERATGITLDTDPQLAGFLDGDDLAHALILAAAARLDLGRRLRLAEDAVDALTRDRVDH
jgi:hypothetical protein